MNQALRRLLGFAMVSGIVLSTVGCFHFGPSDDRFDQVSVALQASASSVPGGPGVPDAGIGGIYPATRFDPEVPQTVEQLVELGLSENPEIREAEFRVESLSHKPVQEMYLPDPTLGTITQISQVQTAAGQQDFSMSLSQKYVRQNKRMTRAEIANNELDAARARLEAARQKVTEQIRNTYYELVFIRDALTILRSDQKQLQVIEQIVDKRFRVLKNVTQQEWLQIQVALSKLRSEIDDYEKIHGMLQSKMARLIHAAPGTQITPANDLDPAELQIEFEELLRLVADSNPELHAQLFEIQQARNAEALAELEHQPDFVLGMNWISTANNGISPVANGNDAFMLSIGMNLPVYRNRIDEKIRQAQTNTLAGMQKYERLKDEKASSVTDLVVQYKTDSANLKLFQEDIIPKQKLTLEQSLRNYEVGSTDYLQMIDNWRKLLQYQIAEKRLQANLQKSLATLAREVGASSLSDLKPE